MTDELLRCIVSFGNSAITVVLSFGLLRVASACENKLEFISLETILVEVVASFAVSTLGRRKDGIQCSHEDIVY